VTAPAADGDERAVRVTAAGVTLDADLGVPPVATGVVLFAHGTGSGRMSPRNRMVAATLRDAGLGTLLLDLLTTDEESADARTGHLRFDIELLAGRLIAAIEALRGWNDTAGLPIGCFGASTGAAAALVAASKRPDDVRAVVSRGGRPDLAGDELARVRAPTRLIVGGADAVVIALNRTALHVLEQHTECRLEIVPGATHLFEEPGALEDVARLARDWFLRHL
jgi:putative phosphoribosyl transferase